jgi:hypothetical protein
MSKLLRAIDRVCKDLPEGYLVSLELEQGAATVTLSYEGGDNLDLPDPADKLLGEQLMDALDVALAYHEA